VCGRCRPTRLPTDEFPTEVPSYRMRPPWAAMGEDQTMRKIVAGPFVSLDGVTEAPETWAIQFHSRIPLTVVDSKTFKTGVVSVMYAPASG
jgi:hypothetical protein